MSRVFLDANILFSASITPEGRTRAIFELAGERVTLLATEYVVSEATRNLERKAPSRLSELKTLLENVAIVEEPSVRLVEELAPLVPDPNDAPILAGAVSGEADLLAAGNERDFRTLYGTEVRGRARDSPQGRARLPHALRTSCVWLPPLHLRCRLLPCDTKSG